MSVSPNPIEMGLTNQVTIRTENLSDAKAITDEQLQKILDLLEPLEENEERLDLLEEEKSPFLFSSDDLIRMVNEITPSVKTRIGIISIIAPRLTDPRAKMQDIVAMFRFSDEKSQVEEMIKARANTMNASAFSHVGGIASSFGGMKEQGRGRGGGRGGAGGRGRGNAVSRPRPSPPTDEGSTDSPGSTESSLKYIQTDQSRSGVVDSPTSTVSSTPIRNRSPESSSNSLSMLDSETIEVIRIEPRRMTHIPEKKTRHRQTLSNVGTASLNSRAGSPTPSMSSLRSGSPIRNVNLLSRNTSTENLGGGSRKVNDSRNTQRVAPEPPRENKVAALWLNRENASSSSSSSSSAGESPKCEIGKLKPSIFERRESVEKSQSLDPTMHARKEGTVWKSMFQMTGLESLSWDTDDPATPSRPKQARRSSNTFAPNGLIVVNTLQCNDIAGRCALALSISKAEFMALQEEGRIESDSPLGTPHNDDPRFADKYSFRELVRRNFCKDYGVLIQSELEKYLRADDFTTAFKKTKEEFYAQPRWKQMAQKKAAMLF